MTAQDDIKKEPCKEPVDIENYQKAQPETIEQATSVNGEDDGNKENGV